MSESSIKNILILGAIAAGVYYLYKKNESAAAPPAPTNSTYVITSPPAPTETTAPQPPTIETNPPPKTTAVNPKGSGASSYNIDKYVATINGQSFSVAPEKAGRLVVQETAAKAQQIYRNIVVNPYSNIRRA